jgi:V/A-type H+/Na+-transporting ATPase subunit I
MAKLQIAGRREELGAVLERLYRMRRVQLVDVAQDPDLQVEAAGLGPDRAALRARLELLVARVEAMLTLVHPDGAPRPDTDADADPVRGAVDVAGVEARLDALGALVEEVTGRLDALSDEQAVLPRYLRPLEQLAPLVPELADLGEGELRRLGLDTVALVLNTVDDTLVTALRRELAEEFGSRFELTWARVGEDAIGCLLVFSHRDTDRVHALLGQEHVRHLPLPSAYAGLSLHGALAAMRGRLETLPSEVDACRLDLQQLVGPHEPGWRVTLAGARAELDQLAAAAGSGVTERAFAVVGWVPRPQLADLRTELQDLGTGPLSIEELRHDPRADDTPVLMRQRRQARPFGLLTRFLDTPRAAGLDPTGLMALFLPLMFGVMVGDVVYGALLLAIGWWVRRKHAGGSLAVADVSSVLVMGAAWSIVFGLLFGEALGDLGKNLFGDFSLWFYRGGADALQPLLLFALAIGAAHVLLGVLLGAWQSWRDREHRHLLDRLGTLAFLCGLLAMAGFAGGALPRGLMTPALAVTVAGLALVMSLHGALGIMMAPLELLGAIGNILSYLRLAAVGLASVYLAVVANELAAVGPLWLGVIVAAFFHTLNLALAGFSPLIQALRLHYVEFFSQFFLGGGRPFSPFGTPTQR